jgi:hypothetical protein
MEEIFSFADGRLCWCLLLVSLSLQCMRQQAQAEASTRRAEQGSSPFCFAGGHHHITRTGTVQSYG